jgi:hypothetical protein
LNISKGLRVIKEFFLCFVNALAKFQVVQMIAVVSTENEVVLKLPHDQRDAI